MFNIGTGELVLIVIAIIILFGAKKIPELAQGIGKGLKEFKKAMHDVEEEIKKPESNNTEEKKEDKK